MKIVFDRQAISNKIAPIMSVVSGKSTLTAVEGILIEAQAPDRCTFTAFDLEKGIKITVDATVLEEGSYIINAQKFNQTLRVMDGEEITLNNVSFPTEENSGAKTAPAMPAKLKTTPLMVPMFSSKELLMMVVIMTM